MSAEIDEFDMDAAWIRRAQSDLKGFMEAFAVRVQSALPGRVSIERRRDGLLSRTSHIREIGLRGEQAVFRLAFDGTQLRATKAKQVRGVVISTAELPFAQWLTEVRGEIRALAGALGTASDAMGEFL